MSGRQFACQSAAGCLCHLFLLAACKSVFTLFARGQYLHVMRQCCTLPLHAWCQDLMLALSVANRNWRRGFRAWWSPSWQMLCPAMMVSHQMTHPDVRSDSICTPALLVFYAHQQACEAMHVAPVTLRHTIRELLVSADCMVVVDTAIIHS